MRLPGWLPRGAQPGATALRALLVVVLALVVAIAHEAVRARRVQEAVLREALREYAGFAAWRFTGELEAVLYVGNVRRLGTATAAGLGARPLPEPDELARGTDGLAGCRCGYVAPQLFHFRADLATGAVALASGETAAPAVLRWLADTLAVAPADTARLTFRTLTGRPPAGPELVVVYVDRLTSDGRPVAAAGFVAPLDRYLADAAEKIAAGELLPASIARGLPAASIAEVRVTTPEGRSLFATRTRHASPDTARLVLDTIFGSPTAQVTLNPAHAARLVPGGAPRSRLPYLLGALAVTAALVVAALRQLRREQALARLRADFTSSVSHELRTPLAQILLFGETLRSDRARSADERRFAVNVIVREARRLIHMVENVLHFARAERGVAVLRPEPLALAPVVDDVVRSFAPLAEGAGTRWRVELDERVVVRADRDAVKQIVLNLLDNAVKYGPAGQTVRVSLDADGGRARLVVEDEGPGVPAARREEVWRPFVRVHSDARRAVTGAGLGLAVVRELVEKHGGIARVESTSGGGARFIVELPAAGRGPRPEEDGVGADDAPHEASPVGPQPAARSREP